MSPDQTTQLILDRIDQVRADLKDDLLDVRRDLRELEAQVKVTNGQVSSLQLWRSKLEGAQWTVGWVSGLFIGFGGAALGAVLGAVMTHLLS